MIELLLNELLSTFPFHFLAYIPFYKKLKYSPLETVLRVCMCQIFYLGIFTILTLAGFSSVWVQYLAVPVFWGFILSPGTGRSGNDPVFLYVYPRLSACDPRCCILYL